MFGSCYYDLFWYFNIAYFLYNLFAESSLSQTLLIQNYIEQGGVRTSKERLT